MRNNLQQSIELQNSLLQNEDFLSSLEVAKQIIIKSLENKGKLMVCGNGGSATQASHMVGEFVGRFSFDRPALPAISLFDLILEHYLFFLLNILYFLHFVVPVKMYYEIFPYHIVYKPV